MSDITDAETLKRLSLTIGGLVVVALVLIAVSAAIG